eukprot:scaffold4515_cov149-Amphora_coffeaeformis.AAC.6
MKNLRRGRFVSFFAVVVVVVVARPRRRCSSAGGLIHTTITNQHWRDDDVENVINENFIFVSREWFQVWYSTSSNIVIQMTNFRKSILPEKSETYYFTLECFPPPKEQDGKGLGHGHTRRDLHGLGCYTMHYSNRNQETS